MKRIGFTVVSIVVLLLLAFSITYANDVFISKASKDIQWDAEYTGDAWPDGRTWSLLNIPQLGVVGPNEDEPFNINTVDNESGLCFQNS